MWQRRFRRKSIGAVPVSPTGWRDPTSPDYEPTAAFTMDRPPLSRTSAGIILRYRRSRSSCQQNNTNDRRRARGLTVQI